MSFQYISLRCDPDVLSTQTDRCWCGRCGLPDTYRAMALTTFMEVVKANRKSKDDIPSCDVVRTSCNAAAAQPATAGE